MENNQTYNSIEEYQSYLKERQELVAYCKKISQGMENLDEKSGERAIWELVQNARDMDENCRIKIELMEDRLVFSHHGKPFDYLSLLALVNQNSSKDNPGADVVGQYGTGFMTTHAFNSIVTVDGPYKAMIGPNTLKGYVELGGFVLDRSSCYNGDDVEKSIIEMRNEMKQVAEMHKKTPIFTELPDKWTSFTYMMDDSMVHNVSKQLESVIRFVPFVLVINARIKEFEVIDRLQNKHFCIRKSSTSVLTTIKNGSWEVIDNKIIYNYFGNAQVKDVNVRSLQSKDGNDVIIIPPYPAEAGQVSTIPSLFLWFPLLGTECFGVNFIFHSKRFYPVEKRNNVILPENVQSKLQKGQANKAVLKEMMQALFDYYAIDDNDAALTREMCRVNFHSDKEDEITTAFYSDMQNIWKNVIPSWKIIPTNEGKKSMVEERVRVLHPDFYKNLDEDKCRKYENILTSFAQIVKFNDKEYYLLPNTDLIAWSEVVKQWDCDNDSSFFITVEDVCKSIQTQSDKLYDFLSFLTDSGNGFLMDEYALLPNRKGELKKKGELRHGDFMSADLYALTELLMGTDALRMININYNNIGNVSVYKPEDLQRAIGQTITQWRNATLGSNNEDLSEDQLTALINFCSASSQDDFNNYRGRMMRLIARIFCKEFRKISQTKLLDKEEDFYSTAFNFLLDYTLYTISHKSTEWVQSNISLLKDFLCEYAKSVAADRISRLDEYAVLPNQNFELCLMKDLFRNENVNEQLAKFYLEVMDVDLHAKWVHDDFTSIFSITEQKASDVANEIQNKLSENDFQDTIVLDIIELTENDNANDWKLLFKTIYAERESIRYKLGTPEERKAINRMMKKKDPELLELMADIADREDARNLIDNVNAVIEQQEHDAYIKMLGTYVENHIQQYLTDKLADCGIVVSNQQGGQDFILSKDGFDDYYVEVKSRWESEQTVDMSAVQFRHAVNIPDRYALIGVNMYHFDRSRAEKGEYVALEEIYSNIKCLDNIGNLEKDLLQRVDDAFKGGLEDIRIDGSYKVRVPQSIFDKRHLDFNGLVDIIKSKFIQVVQSTK